MPRTTSLRTRISAELLEDRSNPTVFMVTSAADSGAGSLRDALAQANAAPNLFPDYDEIHFDPALNNQTIAIQSALPVTNSVRIIGPGANLLTIKHANSNTGTATDHIFNIDDGIVVDPATTEPMGAYIAGFTLTHGGGAIDSREGITVSDCVITDNHGIAINCTGSLRVERTTISNNTGGGIIVSGDNFHLTNSIVSGNTSTGDGGGVRTVSVTDIRFSTITGNTAAGNGGGIFNGLNGFMNIVNSTISKNQAVTGGGIFNVTTVGIQDSDIAGNTASGDGGGFFGPVSMSNGMLDGNTAGGNGGGLAAENTGSMLVNVSGTTIINNSAAGSGGGVYIANSANAGIVASITGNTSAAQTGGGVAVTNNSTATISGSKISTNVGGGIFNQGSTLSLLDTVLNSNHDFGLSSAGTLTVGSSWISSNEGAGITSAGPLAVTGSTISGSAGAGIISTSGSFTAKNSTISGNAGAGILNGGTLASTNLTITGNTPGIQNAGTAALANTIVAGNTTADIAGLALDSASANNLIGDPATAGGLTDGNNGNIVGKGGAARPVGGVLDPVLSDNGGLAPTHKLVAGSPAIDAGNNAAAAGLPFDERGSGFERIANQIVDVGALETQAPVLVVSGQPDGSAGLYTPSVAGQYGPAAGTVSPFGSSSANVRSAVADVNNDGFPDLIFVTGPGRPVRVTVVSGVDNKTALLAPFDPFGGDFTGGGYVAAPGAGGEFAVTPDQGGGPRVVIFGLNNDGTPDLLVAAGFGGGPRVAIFDGTTLAYQGGRPGSGIPDAPLHLVNDFFAFPDDATTLRNGVFAALGDIDGDGFADLIFGGGPGGAPRVYILSGALLMAGSPNLYTQPVANFFVAGNDQDRGGVRLAVKNADDDTKADVVVGSGEGSPAKVRVYLGKNFTGTGEPSAVQDIDVFGGATLTDGVYVG